MRRKDSAGCFALSPGSAGAQMEGEDGLKSYKAIAKTNPELQKAYDEQFKKLCNKS